MEIIPDIAEDVSREIIGAFVTTSELLKLKYPITGTPKVGKNQWEVH